MDRPIPSPRPSVIPLGLADGDGVIAGYTTRHGGASESPYHSLNCGYSAGDAPDAVFENRRRALDTLELRAGDLVVGGQVHGTRVAVVTARERGRGADGPGTVLPETDGLLTDVPGLPLGVLTADCVPVFLAARRPRVVGVLHAGWRGALAGILPYALDLLRGTWGADPRGVSVSFGPAIGPCCFEIRSDVADQAIAHPATGAHLRAAGPDRWRLDLEGHLVTQARLAGVPEARIARTRRCTVCENHDFYSYRREGPRSGRTLSVIAIGSGR